MIRNVFCDFTNKEIRRVYGLYGNVGAAQHESILGGWLNIAGLLTPDFCLIPIGFVAESQTLQTVLERKEALLAGRLLRLAMRDAEIERFVKRRRSDYLPFREDYRPLFDDKTIGFLQRYAPALQARTGRTAIQIGERWSTGVQTAPELGIVRREFSRDQLENLEKLPDMLSNEALGFTWNAIIQRLPPDTPPDTAQSIRRFLHADFVRGYLDEFDLGVLTSLPFGWRDLGVQPSGGYLDYSWLDAALKPLGLLPLLLALDGHSLLALRDEAGFVAFQGSYRVACEKAKSSYELREAFSHGAPGLTKACKQAIALGARQASGEIGLSGEAVQLLGFVLAQASRGAGEFLGVEQGPKWQRVVGTNRLYVEDIDEFAKVRRVSPGDVLGSLRAGRIELSEETVQLAIERILAEPFHKKDWGGEGNDLYSANLHAGARRLASAFLLKGNGLRAAQMQIRDCGKNGDQLVRLTEAPADLFVVQYVGPISEAVIKDMELKIRALRIAQASAQYCIIDGQETARLLRAYEA